MQMIVWVMFFFQCWNVHKASTLPGAERHRVSNLHSFASHHKPSVNKQGQKSSLGNESRTIMLLLMLMADHAHTTSPLNVK